MNEPIKRLWEMRTAFGVARPLIEAGDEVAARMACKEAYTAEVTRARVERRDPGWEPSFGWGAQGVAEAGRKQAVLEAVERGRIGHDQAQKMLPGYRDNEPAPEQPRLEAPTNASKALEHLELMRQLAGKDKAEGAA